MYDEDGCMVRTATGTGVGWMYDGEYGRSYHIALQPTEVCELSN